MATQQNLTPLKILVFSMGFILAGGTVLLAGLVWHKFSSGPISASSADCPGGNVDLKGYGAVVDSSLDGRIMRLVFEQQGAKREIVMVDICSAKITGKLAVTIDSALIQD